MGTIQTVKRLPVSMLRRVKKYHDLRRAAKQADCFLTSYPKSGRTWLRYIISSYLNQIHEVGIDIDLTTTFKLVPNFDLDLERGIPAFEGHRSTPDMPMILVSHLRHSPLLFQKRPIVFLVRDPRDVMVSSYFHATRHKKRFDGDMSAFLKDPSQGLKSLIDYLNNWARGLKDHPHFVTSYEKMTIDPDATVASIIDFIGIPVIPEAVSSAVAEASFNNMRKSEVSVGIPGHDYDRTDEKSLRMRRGKVGGFHDDLSPEQITYIDQTISKDLSTDAKKLMEHSYSAIH